MSNKANKVNAKFSAVIYAPMTSWR